MITFTESAHKNALIAEGGEGKIYKYKQNYLLKIFKDSVNKQEKLKKIKQIMKISLPASVITPIDLVYDTNHNFIGYSMKKIDGEELTMLSSRKFIRTNNITKKEILNLLIQIHNTLNSLHSKDIYIGDLSDLNILFDDANVYFIDIDSWSVGTYRCTVANDAFKDPKLIKNYFDEGTDNYAFAIMAYKSLTRLHPFGGLLQTNTKMGLRERMVKGLCVINNDDVKIPRMVDKHVFFPKKIIHNLEMIFTTEHRHLEKLDDFHKNLTLCSVHNDYYYARYDKCPVCEDDAKERKLFTKVGVVDGIPVRVLFTNPDIKIIYNELVYLTKSNQIQFRNSSQSINYEKGSMYGINHDGTVFYKILKDKIFIKTSKKVFELKKKYNTAFKILNNEIYYISNSLALNKFGLLNEETSYAEKLQDVSINNIFNIESDKNYFICNSYDSRKIINVSGYNYFIENDEKIANHLIHYDPFSKTWLFIYETINNNFYTLIIDKNKGILYNENGIKYIGNLSKICYHNNLIYKPADGSIVRFNYKTNEYKSFTISIVSSGTKLIKKGKKFIAINEKEIYEIG